jgi:hypothetical protein
MTFGSMFSGIGGWIWVLSAPVCDALGKNSFGTEQVI